MLTLVGWVALAAAAYWANRNLFEEAFDYLAPIVLLIAAVRVGWMNRTDLGVEGAPLLKRGLAFFMAAVALWLWLPSEPEFQIPWEAYAQKPLDAAKREGRPVMIWFTAAWCEPCRRLERKVFSKEPVVEAARRFVAVKADMTDSQSEEAIQLAEKFHIRGYPTVIFLGSDGVERNDYRLVGYEGPQAFVKRLEAVP